MTSQARRTPSAGARRCQGRRGVPVHADGDGQYSFSETTPANVDLWVKTSCGATTCVGSASQPEVASMTLTAGTTYCLFVRYDYPDDNAAISVTVSSP